MKLPGEDKRKIRRSTQSEDVETEQLIEAALDREAIARLAYSYWEARGDDKGSPEEDWFKAEAELRGDKKSNHQP